jgi:methylenetetrahydrofolate--tRNA-(uracil-5-)-methyltransferase
VLDRQLRLNAAPHIRFAGQVTGCEGYVESAAIGLAAGMMAACELSGSDWSPPPASTALGALLSHITGDAEAATFQPMNVNFGLFPPLHEVKKKQRKEAYTNRAKDDLKAWLDAQGQLVAA